MASPLSIEERISNGTVLVERSRAILSITVEVERAIRAIEDARIREKASKIADVTSFKWIRESDNETLVRYQTSYIYHTNIHSELEVNWLTRRIAIVEAVKASANTSFAVIIGPQVFPRYFNNTNISGNLAKSHRGNVPYALKALNLPNIITYIDVGHSNSMNWDPAGSPSQFRSFATNVASFNSWNLLASEFVPATHAIMDTRRSGVFGLRESWDDWCNVNGAGLGITWLTSQTGDGTVGAFVNDLFELGYGCILREDDALKPSPAAGLWYQTYFEMLVRNANPSL
ncbi:glycoside hydrolase family 6 protein [Hypoxylon sp. FL0890]|nr:glycoside hydrolase family 6 protein [Hypoxylon sp. FL0890]